MTVFRIYSEPRLQEVARRTRVLMDAADASRALMSFERPACGFGGALKMPTRPAVTSQKVYAAGIRLVPCLSCHHRTAPFLHRTCELTDARR